MNCHLIWTILMVSAWLVDGFHMEYYVASNISSRFLRSVGDLEWPWRPDEWLPDNHDLPCGQEATDSQEQDCDEENSKITDLSQKLSELNTTTQVEIKLKDALQAKISELEKQNFNLRLENALAQNNAKPDTSMINENNELKLKIRNLETKVFTIEMEHNSCSRKLPVLENSLREESQKSQSLSNEVVTLKSGTQTLEYKLYISDEENKRKDEVIDKMKSQYDSDLQNCNNNCVVDKKMRDKFKDLIRG